MTKYAIIIKILPNAYKQKGEFPKIYNYDLEMIKKKDSFIEGKLINWY